jgi:hypothetical protein
MLENDSIQTDMAEKTGTLVLLSIATGGFYLLLYLMKNYKLFNKSTHSETISKTLIISAAIAYGISGYLNSLALSAVGGPFDNLFEFRSALDTASGLSALSGIAVLAYSAILVVMAFNMGKALERYALKEFRIDLKLNKIYLFMFTIFYINYAINDLDNLQQRQKILAEGH